MHIPFIDRSRSNQEQSSAVSLEREGQEWLDRITGAARAEPWQVTLLKLAWTAGPATFIAASLSFYLGFGKFAPLDNLKFFFAYTILTGLIGLAAGIFARATYGARRKKAQKNLLKVSDLLPDLIASVRNLYLTSLEPEVRQLEAAGLLLQRVDIDSMALEPIIEEMGAGSELAKAAAKIDVYRIAGLYSRMDELVEKYAEQSQPVIAALEESAPKVASLLRDRLNGRAPTFNEGIPRDSNFLERTLSAMEQEDDQLMTLLDAEEVLVLACELINNRSIPMLIFTYRGRWELVHATALLERRRNLYRIANSTVLSRLKALVALLGESDDMEGEGVRGLKASTLFRQARRGINDLNDMINSLVERLPALTSTERKSLRRGLRTLRTALKLIGAMRRAARHATQRHALFLRTVEKWGRTLEGHEALEMDAPGRRRRGLQVVEKHIELNDEECLELSGKIALLFREYEIVSRDERLLYRHGERHRPLTTKLAKELAMEIASALQPFVDITRPDVQRAIDASPAANLMGLEVSLSARTKAAWATAAVQEVEDDLALPAERLAATLVTTYRVKLSEAAIEFLNQSYGARIERLQELNNQEAKGTRSGVRMGLSRP
ncbi:MAG: hypothetical protein OEL79_02890, partial [Chromatiales bacterium]|nr:hypothetical protein [Chromatiales bacterium]